MSPGICKRRHSDGRYDSRPQFVPHWVEAVAMQQVQCPHCGQSYDIPTEQVPRYAGQTIVCTACQKPFAVPAAAAAAYAGAPPPPPAAMPGAHAPYAQPDYATAQGAPQQTNGWAVTSLVSGILGFCLPLVGGLVAIITGVVGLTRTRDPRVGGKGLAIAGISVGAASILLSGCTMSILLPSLNRAREQANRIKCASNLRQIGQALNMYAASNGGQFPPDLPTLLAMTGMGVTSATFVCPSSQDAAAPGATPAAQAGNLTKGPHLSYVYVPGLTVQAPAGTVLMHERLTNHRNDGINVLYVDGSVNWIPRAQVQAVIPQAQPGATVGATRWRGQQGQDVETDVERAP
jgi:prepilin-type processing-associated H-X9-DG protein